MIKNTNIKRVLNLVLCLTLILQFVPILATTPAVAADANGNKIMVSMGDSYSSGDGIPPYYGQGSTLEESAGSEDWLAHRSQNSWPGQLEMDGVDGIMADYYGEDSHWYFVASSGAETRHIITDSQRKTVVRDGVTIASEDLRPQIEIFDELEKQGKKADYVTVTIGGNDLGFSEVVKEASIAGLKTPFEVFSNILTEKWDYFEEQGKEDIKETYREIWRRSGGAKIIVAGYPTLLDDTGKGLFFFKRTSQPLNESIRRFNSELEEIVNELKGEGIKICFVSVQDEFEGHEAYTDEPFINEVDLSPNDDDLSDEGMSMSSIHPNPDGAREYADAVNAKIEEIEKDGGKSEWPDLVGSDEREIVLVLDNSGSMNDGNRLGETKEASKKFFDAILKEDASVGIVTYNTSASKLAYFNRSESYLDHVVDNLGTAGRTNTDAGLQAAELMLSESNAKKKIIVLMSDGDANEGRVGSSLIAYADQLKAKGIYIYTLGFLLDSSNAQSLMQGIASPGCHYEVDDGSSLSFFFGDIADLIRGEKYIYVRIACPVDVVVKHGGEVLSSKDGATHQRTDFGTLTYEKTTNSGDNIKILRLKPGAKYDIEIEGYGNGTMNYTIGYMDEDGNYSDMREFNNIRITDRTKIDTIAVEDTDYTVLNVDEDGDGSYDLVYKAGVNQTAEIIDASTLVWVLVLPIIVLFGIIAVLIVKKYNKKKAAKETENI